MSGFKTIFAVKFGEFGRYELRCAKDRFGDILYSVYDADIIDPDTGGSYMIRCYSDLSDALVKLPYIYPRKPKPGEWVVNLDKIPARFVKESGSDWVLQTQDKKRFLADPSKCVVIRDCVVTPD